LILAPIRLSDRISLNEHRPACLWFTGFSGSGKSTLAGLVEEILFHEYHAHTYLLDGDNLRTGLNRDLDFSPAGRKENIRRSGEVARLFYDAGLIVLTTFISPFRADRDFVRSLLPGGSFFEIYVRCPLEICEQRDPKGLYRKARNGSIPDFTGISSPYEEPLFPELVLDTSLSTPGECAQQTISYCKTKGIFG
jgi:adenylylsulfate kinase